MKDDMSGASEKFWSPMKCAARTRFNIVMLILSSISCVALILLLDTWRGDLCRRFSSLTEYTPYFIGYFFAVCVGTFSIDLIRRPAMKYLEETQETYKSENRDKLLFLLGDVIGVVERIVYVSAFIADQAAFVAVWLGVKIALSFKRYEERFSGREMYNVFTLGALLSLGYAFIGWKLTEWCANPCHTYRALVFVILLPVSCFGLLIWVLANIRTHERGGNVGL